MTDPTPTQSLTPEQVRSLLDGITPGRWTVELDGNICANYEFRDGKHVADWIAEVDHANQSDYQDDGYNQYSPTADNNAALICAAPDLATAYLQMAEENARLREALAWYGEQARLCRLIHSEGDAGRYALSNDGGKRARAALTGADS